MKTYNLFGILALALCTSVIGIKAFAWGGYAHQQINVEAVKLFHGDLPGNSLGACMSKNINLMQRLAITPDYDWKVVGTVPTDAPSIAARKASDQYEHPLHFFEADAFAGDYTEFLDLPSGEFQSVLAQYKELAKANASAIATVDPSKAIKDLNNITVEDVTVHGTAPWRIMQMYNLAVDLLSQCKSPESKTCNVEKALTYLGAMGHYVGDMSQPLHATLNYDGQYNGHQVPSRAVGLHAAFETEMFNLLNGKNDLEDKIEFTYPQFNITQDAVDSAARQEQKNEPLTALAKSDIIQHVFIMIGRGYDVIDSMISHFADDVIANPTKSKPAVNSGSMTAVKKMKTPTARKPNSTSVSTLQYADNRMGAAAALLARLWLSAATDAGDPQINCPALTFSRANAIMWYQIPDYLPAGHQKVPQGGASEPGSSHPSVNAIKAFTKDLL